jgi:DNA-3-methyladenine glycosylase
MFGAAGLAYVYRIHRSYCLNVVTGPEGRGEAVLIRAAEPVDGLDAMRDARAHASVAMAAPEGFELTNGPGKLCQALELGVDLDGIDLLDRGAEAPLYLEPRIGKAPDIVVSRRIGISVATDSPLRFAIAGNGWISRAGHAARST